MNAIKSLSLVTLALFLLLVAFGQAQDGNPRHPGVARFELIANNTAADIVPLSDLNADGLADFALIVGGDVWVYLGVKGGLPESTSGLRLGPTETESNTRIIAVGDWDGMNGPDICTRIQLEDDTSFGNAELLYTVSRTIVFWNDGHGRFSVNDTTHLSSGVAASFNAGYGTSADLNKDGVSDLFTYGSGGGIRNGESVKFPRSFIYLGHKGQRWGRGEIPNIPDWLWWNAPNTSRLDAEDLDMDSAIDLTFIYDGGKVTVLYGSPNNLPDTGKVESLDLWDSLTSPWSVFADVTGDGIPDLCSMSQLDDLVRIYVGCKGQRLLEQFGTGNEPPDGEHWWGKPWAVVKSPKYVNSVWLGLEKELFDLGSADSNATEEIWVVSQPYLLCYDVGGQVIEGVRYGLDSLFDGQAQIQPVPWSGVLLGDIDGDSKNEFAITNFDGVHIYRTVDQLPTPTGSWWRVPSCDTTLSVSSPPSAVGSPLSLRALPNPASGDVRILWQKEYATGLSATLRVSDILGQEVVTISVPAYRSEAVWDASKTFGGRYFITLTIGDRSETTEIVIQR